MTLILSKYKILRDIYEIYVIFSSTDDKIFDKLYHKILNPKLADKIKQKAG